jgi:hypothetical protein
VPWIDMSVFRDNISWRIPKCSLWAFVPSVIRLSGFILFDYIPLHSSKFQDIAASSVSSAISWTIDVDENRQSKSSPYIWILS